MNNTNVVLMHGKDTDPSKKWYSWFAREVQKHNLKFDAPNLPKPSDPVLDEWVNELLKLDVNENSILVGHSRGGVAILRYLESQPEDFKVKKVILVAPNSGYASSQNKSLNESNYGFYNSEGYDYLKIRKHCNDFVVLHSRDDEWVPFSHGEEVSKGLEAKFLVYENLGHFGSRMPKQEIPDLMKEVLD